MPNIFIDVWTRLHERSNDEVNKDLQKRFTKAGNDAGDNFAKEFERSLNASNPRIRKAAERLADSTAIVAQNNRLRALSEQRIAEASKATSDVEARLAQMRRDGQASASALTREENRLAGARRETSRAEREFVRDTSNFERAAARRTAAIKNLVEAQRGGGGGRRGGGGRGGGFDSFERGLGGVFTSIPFVPGGKAGAVIGTGLVTGLGAIVEAVTTASQALWLLPAAATAAGAGVATLTIGMSGFDKALKDMGNAKKFAEDLQGLAPNAQQAALEIQHLVGGLDSLKKLVQQSLFSGVAQQLHALGNAFMPQLRGMFTGIAGAFNSMFSGAVGQLTSSGSISSIDAIINNIVKAFQNLAPAIAPVVDAFTRIARVGSDFLPGLGSSITDLARRFDEFITHAQQTGQLQHWIRQGLDAAKALGNFLGELAHKFYDVFGGKSPQEFSQTLHGIVGTLTSIGTAMVGLANGVNTVVQDLQPVAQAFGGWPHLIEAVITVWALWKVGGLIGDLMKVGTLLGITLPAAAETGAGRISAALASIAMPAWIATFLALWNLHGDSPGTSAATANDKQIAGNRYAQAHGGKMPDGYAQWVQGTGPMPKDLGPLYHPGEKPGDPTGQKPGDAKWPSGAWGDKPWADPGNKSGGKWGNGYSPYDVPGVPGKGGIGKDKVATPYGSDYDAPPRPGESAEEYRAEGEVLDARHRSEQDRATLQAMEKDNNVTAEQLQAQKNKIAKDERELNEAQLHANEVHERALKKTTGAMDEIGVKLDKDLGISKGLPGIADNIVRFLANLAFAPAMGALEAVKQANGGVPNGAKGLVGAAALNGAFGQQYVPEAEGGTLGAEGGKGVTYDAMGRRHASPGRESGALGMRGAVPGMAGFAGAGYNAEGGAPGGGAPGSLEAWIAAGEQASGVDASWTAGLRTLIGRESGGNPNAINQWDSNARAGHPSQGLMQTVPGTFGAYHVPGTSDSITDPVANIAAGIRYIQQRYGGIEGVQQANPNLPPKGYARGGDIQRFASGGAPQAAIFQPKGTDTVPAMLTPGEHVLTVDDVKALGGQKGVYALRQSLQDNSGAGHLNSYHGAVQPTVPQGERVTTPLAQIPNIQRHGEEDMKPLPKPHSSGFGITGGGLIGVGEGVAIAAIQEGIDAAMSAHPSRGGAIQEVRKYARGGAVGFDGGGSVSGAGVAAFAQVGLDEINRAIGYAGQAASIGAEGLLSTFTLHDPTGLGDVQQGWAGKLLGGFAGARPGLPNTAGAKEQTVKDQNQAIPNSGGSGAGVTNNTGTHVARDQINNYIVPDRPSTSDMLSTASTSSQMGRNP